MPENEDLNPVEGQDVKDQRRLEVADAVQRWLATGGRIQVIPAGVTTDSAGEDQE